ESCRLPQGKPDAVLGRQLGIDVSEGTFGVGERVAELDERVARDQVARRRSGGSDVDTGRELLLELEHDTLRRLAADTGDRLETRGVLERNRASQLGGPGAGDDGERDLGPDTGDGQKMREELPLLRVREAVELEGVLAHVQIGLEHDLLGAARLA